MTHYNIIEFEAKVKLYRRFHLTYFEDKKMKVQRMYPLD